MNYAFVHGLWGDETTLPHYRDKLHQIVLESRDHQPDDLAVYACGKDNVDIIRDAGYDPIMLHENPIVNWDNSTEPRNTHAEGRMNWGLSFWRHKLECIKAALGDFDAVVWLDWDVHCVAPVPDDYWEELAEGQPIQAALRRYKHRQCKWRAGIGEQILPHGACIYCRDITIVERTIEVHRELADEYGDLGKDETAIARVIDERMGGWKGVEEYCIDYDLPYYDMRKRYARLPDRGNPIVFLNRGRF